MVTCSMHDQIMCKDNFLSHLIIPLYIYIYVLNPVVCSEEVMKISLGSANVIAAVVQCTQLYVIRIKHVAQILVTFQV